VNGLEGRVVIVTGAGRGLGRAHALLLGSLGVAVVVNDLGSDVHGEGADTSPAADVVREIEERGGRAVVSGHDVADWAQAAELIRLAVDTFGDLHGLVNNAGILRDRTLANLTEAEWDGVIRVHLKGHAAPTRHAVEYWRSLAKEGRTVRASIVHTTSIAAFGGNFGQANYTAAKSAIIGLSRVAALEGERYGIRSNAVSPSARTRIGLEGPGAEEAFAAPTEQGAFDRFDPANVSPLVAWLLAEHCPANAQIFHIDGNRLCIVQMPAIAHELHAPTRWTLEKLDDQVPPLLLRAPEVGDFLDVIPASSKASP
jgi:NAD(P)-dependent dehydrogenase (short-subunit alcohol dehydrogenase family)